MYKNITPFGFHVYDDSLGKAWIDLVSLVYLDGEISYDEKRERKAVQNIHLKVRYPLVPDVLIETYGNKENLNSIIQMTFEQDKMVDIDITPSFRIGAKSYFARLKDGDFINFIVERLSRIPESKKAVIVFPNLEDYKKILENHNDDYLPCLVSLQFRLIKNAEGYSMNTFANFRSLDVFQKAHGNLIAIGMLIEKVKMELEKRLNTKISISFLEAFIVDGHIYSDTLNDVTKLMKEYHKND